MILPRHLRAAALLLTTLSLLVVGVSSYLRLESAGLGCVDWPACYGRPPVLPVHSPYYSPLRLAHRIMAVLSLLLTIHLLWRCRRSPALSGVARSAAALLFVMLALATLGIWSGQPRLAPIVFLNLLGGLALVSFSWRIVLATHVTTPLQRHPPTLHLGALLLTMTVLFGAGIGAAQLAPTCPSFPACNGQWWPGTADWAALWMALSDGPTQPASGVPLHLLHRYGALFSLLLLVHAAVAIWRNGNRRRAAAALLAALTSTIIFGAATVVSGLPLGLTMAHVLGVALTLTTLATLLRR
ncbi:MAG TPA: COX15/CtaA family protein [Accumulibacter sp.]|nr:COX15/CtaA family protein [Accumulibacter sp.]HMW16387.1 COX15/CtaA family protein [Accumulibacter sp.]HMX23001.1 COX15/CtaA family protein [Accumulibacter sp.]HMY06591.1 COX15/CtaA family protein [Accumulibacter sp.]HNC16617.1 COX15/CtaA family protein [Accumulibacter sp.]